MAGKTFIFDYDDTLQENHHDYSIAHLKFCEFVIEALGWRAPDVQSIINIQVKIDESRVKELGFSMERFPGSFQMAYRQICEQRGVIPDERDVRHAYDIGMLAFDEYRYYKKGLLPNVPETLDFLTQQGDTLMLITKGDFRVQEKKLNATRVAQWFGKRMRIVPAKTPRVLMEMVSGDYEHVWHVGNGMNSDVWPALKAGMGAIYIPCETWHYERNGIKKPENEPRFIEIPEFSVLRNIYERL